MIIKKKDGFHVVSEDGKKNLGGPYKTKAEAEKRLKQVEWFKHKKKSLEEQIRDVIIKENKPKES